MKRALTFLLVIALLFASTGIVQGWEQPAHQAINLEALNLFTSGLGKGDKYRNALFETDYFCTAPVVTTTGKFSLTYDQIWLNSPVQEHIVHGGFSADEPNIYVSMKHFYDPLALSGVHELTDQSSAHGMAYEAIPATQWALYRMDNPYCLTAAMMNYKASLEIPYTARIGSIPVNGNFRDFAGSPADLEEMRSMYLGKAMRGMGEVMHLVADMTQPAHVRNDSHPRTEITEQAITGGLATILTSFPRSDGQNVAALGNTIEELMVSLAFWTNSHFFSSDTITDPKLGISPANGEQPYASPTLSSLKPENLDGYSTWYAQFGREPVPMVRKLPGIFWDSYEITQDFAIRQGEVLLPLAVAACARTIDLFLPTLALYQDVEETVPDADLLSKAKEAGADDLRQFTAYIDLNHMIGNDPQWRAMGLEIRYSGPGELWRIRNGRKTKISDIEFVDGSVAACQDPVSGEMSAGRPQLLMPLGAPDRLKLSGPAVDYTVEMDDALFIVVAAGARTIQSDPYVFAQNEPSIRLTADRTTIMPGEKVTFSAEIEDPPERYELEWTFGDEDAEDLDSFQPLRTRRTTLTHVYEQEKEYTVKVRLIDRKRKIVRAEDTLDVSALFGDLSGPWNIQLTVQKENSFFRQLIVMIMKGIIRVILAPLAEALELGPIDESVVDSFTFVGTTMEYVTNLTRSDEEDLLYQGPMTFTGSNTGYLEGAGDVSSVSLVMRQGSLVFYAHGGQRQWPVRHIPLLDAWSHDRPEPSGRDV